MAVRATLLALPEPIAFNIDLLKVIKDCLESFQGIQTLESP